MIRAHKIALDPTAAQEEYFRRAAGTARYAYNWALAEWKRQYAAGEKPSAGAIKAKWNAHRKADLPWTYDVTKCASAQAVINLGLAFGNFFRDLKKPKSERRSRYPRFKKRGMRDSFALWNDQFSLRDSKIRIPNLGWVRLSEPLRFEGKVLGATVSCNANRWSVAVQVEVPDSNLPHPMSGTAVGIDVGISTLMALSRPLNGEVKIPNPKARKVYRHRLAKLQRRISRQELVRRKTNAKRSNRQTKRKIALSKLYYRVSCLRMDAIHKATTAIAKAFETVVHENLNVSGMSKNHALAGSVLDASFREIRRQLEYKTAARSGRVVLADRWFPSSKTCSDCGSVADKMPLSVREWTCPECGCVHDRDLNAAKNLEHIVVGQAMPEPSSESPVTTHGEIAALTVPKGNVKLRSMNRELNPCALVRTN